MKPVQNPEPDLSQRPNILFIMTDQQRLDTIASLGNSEIHTPNLDRLVHRGATLSRCYSPFPVCVPARYSIRTGRTPLTTGYFQNEPPSTISGESTEDRCGPYLARAMRERGYRTFGIGKFHTIPVEEDIGYDVFLRSEEMDGYPDAYSRFIWSHPATKHIEQLHGERTNMYYHPQTSPLPQELTVERWAADQAVAQIRQLDDRPYFGLVSFVGPHPPFAPPVPYNRMYDPDRMRDPIPGPDEIDFMDERVRWNSYFVFAEDISNATFRSLRARYYGEISYMDNCLGRILDAVEASPEADNTLICFFADHGEFLGDHQAVQKENFFEESVHVPMLLSWPEKIDPDTRCATLASLTDLFGIATTAAGSTELRDGVDILGILEGTAEERKYCFSISSPPGDLNFRMMCVKDSWKYIFHANGGGELLFDLSSDPREHNNLLEAHPQIHEELKSACLDQLRSQPLGAGALDGEGFKSFPRTPLKLERCYQMNTFRGVTGFPEKPEEVSYSPSASPASPDWSQNP